MIMAQTPKGCHDQDGKKIAEKPGGQHRRTSFQMRGMLQWADGSRQSGIAGPDVCLVIKRPKPTAAGAAVCRAGMLACWQAGRLAPRLDAAFARAQAAADRTGLALGPRVPQMAVAGPSSVEQGLCAAG